MERDPGELKASGSDMPSSVEDARIDALLASLPPAPGILHVDDEDEESDARPLADVAAGRFHEHEVVGRWLKTWGRADQKPFKEWLASQDD